MENLKFKKVKSSNVIAVTYDQANQMLGVAYKTGVYFYTKVEPVKWDLMKMAESVGKFINTNIKPHHEFIKPENYKLVLDESEEEIVSNETQ
jgi:hypothetical protein